MSEIKPKSPDIIQAQIATFATERVKDDQDREYIFANLGAIAVDEPKDLYRPTYALNWHSEKEEFVKELEDDAHVVSTAEDYIRFLKENSSLSDERIKGRAELLRSYREFQPAVKSKLAEVEGLDRTESKEHTDYLGNGRSSFVFMMDVDGVEFAVRKPAADRIRAIDAHVEAALLAKNVPHLEQIVAISYEDGVTVAERMPGKPLNKVALADIEAISDQQLGEMVDTIITIDQKGIGIDRSDSSNFYYDPSSGFGFLDLHAVKEGSAEIQLAWYNIGHMTQMFQNLGRRGGEDPESIKQAYQDVIGRYRAVVANKLAGNDREKALHIIDEYIPGTPEYEELRKPIISATSDESYDILD